MQSSRIRHKRHYVLCLQRTKGEGGRMEEIKKRTDYISWDEYFMGVADLSGRRSKEIGRAHV